MPANKYLVLLYIGIWMLYLPHLRWITSTRNTQIISYLEQKLVTTQSFIRWTLATGNTRRDIPIISCRLTLVYERDLGSVYVTFKKISTIFIRRRHFSSLCFHCCHNTHQKATYIFIFCNLFLFLNV